jgi:hypothetical protein
MGMILFFSNYVSLATILLNRKFIGRVDKLYSHTPGTTSLPRVLDPTLITAKSYSINDPSSTTILFSFATTLITFFSIYCARHHVASGSR